MIEVLDAIDVEGCQCCGQPALLLVRVNAGFGPADVFKFCRACADNLMVLLSRQLGYGVLDPDLSGEAFFNDKD